MSCLTILFTPVGGDTELQASPLNDVKAEFVPQTDISSSFTPIRDLSSSFTPVNHMRATFAMVCVNSIGEYDFLYACDGILLTVDGGKIMVKKRR